MNSVSTRRFVHTILESAVTAIAMAAAFELRFDFFIPSSYVSRLRTAVVLAVLIKAAAFHLPGLRWGEWYFAGFFELLSLAIANAVASVAFTIAALLVFESRIPRAIYGIDFLLCFLLSGAVCFSRRWYREILGSEHHGKSEKTVLIYGAGMSGMTLVREFRARPALGRVVGFLDDAPAKQGSMIMGVRVLGNGRDALRIVEQHKRRHTPISEIIIAMPSATGRQIREALASCNASGVPYRTIPSLGELLTGKVLSAQIRNVSVSDLLGREPVQLEEPRIRQAVAGRCVMVTGAAGSIGSELCRQLAAFAPARLLAVDQAESELFKLDLELRGRGGRPFVGAIADVRNYDSIQELVREHAVESIFHAAAYKHVPLMEEHILEAAQNNILGTWNVARAALMHGVSSFLMISSDKAVNPTNVMGATKRVAELIVSAMQESPQNRETRFVSVRFGNVLGSNGSVVPVFQAQINAGGPVTVTHPQVRRYFMTVREAVQLVLQASTMGKGAEVFVLDMGEPMLIADLARNMIRLAGLVPDEDIELRFVGLRPGEKLTEEVITKGEYILPTHHDKIKIFGGREVSFSSMQRWVADLLVLLLERDRPGAMAHLKKIVPEYQPWPSTDHRAAGPSPAVDFSGKSRRAAQRALAQSA